QVVLAVPLFGHGRRAPMLITFNQNFGIGSSPERRGAARTFGRILAGMMDESHGTVELIDESVAVADCHPDIATSIFVGTRHDAGEGVDDYQPYLSFAHCPLDGGNERHDIAGLGSEVGSAVDHEERCIGRELVPFTIGCHALTEATDALRCDVDH